MDWTLFGLFLLAALVAASRSSGAGPYRFHFVQAALMSPTNPKGLVFYMAFLPQFVSPGADPHMQLAILGASYIGVFLIAELGYAEAGLAVSGLAMTTRAVRLTNRTTGSVLIAAGLLLSRFERS